MWFRRRGAGVKRAIRSASDGGKRAVLREEHEVSRKAIAQGRPGCPRCPVCSCALLFAQIARETAGAASTRSSLRPLIRWRANEDANLGRPAPRDYEVVFRRMGGVQRYPSPHTPALMGIAALHPSFGVCGAMERGGLRSLSHPDEAAKRSSRRARSPPASERDCPRNRLETRADRMSQFFAMQQGHQRGPC